MRRALAVTAAAAALGALAAAAAASIVLRVTPRELADTANLVVEGRVATVDVRWDEGRTCINTYATLAVERVHKGQAGGQVVVKVPGGRVGDEEVRVEGVARFAAGEEVMAFLWKDGRGEWIVLGEAQGKFLLTQEAKTGRRMAENSLKGLCLVMRGDAKAPGAATARRADRLPFDDLAAVVRASVEDQRRATAAQGASRTGGTAAPRGTDAGAAATAGGEGNAGRDPAPRDATPDPPTTKEPDAGAPPPTQDPPAPPAEKSAPPAEEPKPAPDGK